MTARISNNAFVQVLDPHPSELVGWYCRVLAETDYSTVIAEVVRFEELSFQKEKNGYGGGSITIDLDDPIWTDPLPAGQTTPLIDQEAIWQVYEDGILRLEFFAEELEEKRVSEDKRVVTLAGRGVGSVLEWGIHLPFFYPTDLTTERVILGGTTMNAWLGLFWEAQARGNLTWVNETFDYATDSRGTNWPDYPDGADFSITAGVSLYELLTDYCEQLDATWRMLPNFQIWVEMNNGNHLEDQVVFTIGGQQLSQNRKRSRREIANQLYVYSERKNGAHVSEFSDGASVTKWRRREQWVEANNAGASARNLIGLSTLETLKDERGSREIKVPYDSPGRRLFVDYDVNDWVTVEKDTGDNGDDVMQVLTASVRVNKDQGVDLELTLGTRFDAREIKVQKALDKNSSGTSTGSMIATPAKKNSTRSSIMSTKIDDLANIDVVAPTTGDTFIYNSTTQVFESVPNTFEQLVNVDMTGVADGDVPAWDDTLGLWVPGSGGGGSIAYQDTPPTPDVGALWVDSGGWDGDGEGWPPDSPSDPMSIYDYEFEDISTSLPSGWSWVNQGGSTYQEKFGWGWMTIPPATSWQNRVIVRSAPATSTFTITAKCRFAAVRAANYANMGIVLRESGSGKMFGWLMDPVRGLAWIKWNSATSYSSESSWYPVKFGDTLYLRLKKNSATSYDMQFSTDGVGYLTIFSAYDVSGFLSGTIDQLGLVAFEEYNSGAVMAFNWVRVT